MYETIFRMDVTFGYVYVIITREFLNALSPVLKIGYSINISHRLSQYPKGSRLLYTRFVENVKSKETEVLRMLQEGFQKRKDIGKEYFEGSPNAIINCVDSILSRDQVNVFEVQANATEEEMTHTEGGFHDSDLAIRTFFTTYLKEHCISYFMPLGEIYQVFQEWMLDNASRKSKKTISIERFCKGLKRNFNIERVMYQGEVLLSFKDHVQQLDDDNGILNWFRLNFEFTSNCQDTYPFYEIHTLFERDTSKSIQLSIFKELIKRNVKLYVDISGKCIGIIQKTKTNQLENFIASNIQQEDKSYFTLKEAKVLMEKQNVKVNIKFGSLKKDFEKMLNTKCIYQKKILGKNVKNIFYNFKLSEK